MKNLNTRIEQGRELINNAPKADLTVHDIIDLAAFFKSTKEAKGDNEAIYQVIEQSYFAGVSAGANL